MELLIVAGGLLLAAALGRSARAAEGGQLLGAQPMQDREPPAGSFRARIRAAARRVNTRQIPLRLIEDVAVLETGNGAGRAYQRTNNAFSIHATTSWPGRVYDTKTGRFYGSRAERDRDPEISAAIRTGTEGEALRVYATLEESVADFCRLIATAPRYQRAYAHARAQDAAGFFHWIVQADGAEGYVGKPGTKKAVEYEAALMRIHRG